MSSDAGGEAAESEADARAREIEEQMTDDERFSLVISVTGATGGVTATRDPRIPEGVATSAGYSYSTGRHRWRSNVSGADA
jgi:beta-glucosidase